MRSLLWLLMCALTLASCGRNARNTVPQIGHDELVTLSARLDDSSTKKRVSLAVLDVQQAATDAEIAIERSDLPTIVEPTTTNHATVRLAQYSGTLRKSIKPHSSVSKTAAVMAGHSNKQGDYHRINGYEDGQLIAIICLTLVIMLIAVFLMGVTPYPERGFWLGVGMLFLVIPVLYLFYEGVFTLRGRMPRRSRPSRGTTESAPN